MPSNKPLNLPNNPKYIVIHCSATSDNPKSKWYDAGEAEINEMHKAKFRPSCQNGKLVHTGYHYIIKKNGQVETGKTEDLGGQHAKFINTKSIGICCMGNGNAEFINNETVFVDSVNGMSSILTTMQQTELYKLINKLMTKYNIPIERVIGHHDVYKLKHLKSKYNNKMLKTCPGFSVKKYMTGYFLQGDYNLGQYQPYEVPFT